MATTPSDGGSSSTSQPRNARTTASVTAEERSPTYWTPADAWEQVLHAIDHESERPPAGARGFAEFELDFERALMRQLGPFFEHLPALQLTPENIRREVEERARGAYYLILDAQLVYIGKSDAKAGLQARLLRHYKTLKRRQGIEWARMNFKAVKVASLAALDTESLLLRLYEMTGELTGGQRRPEWNYSGFGSNDPGVRRDTQRVSLFDQKYPLDLAATIDFEDPLPGQSTSLEQYVKWLRRQLKFTFRLQTKRVPTNCSLKAVIVNTEEMTASTRLQDLALRIHEKLPSGWVLTVLRGKFILYLNDTRDYKSPLWRLVAGAPAGTPDYTLGDVGDGGSLESSSDTGALEDEVDDDAAESP